MRFIDSAAELLPKGGSPSFHISTPHRFIGQELIPALFIAIYFLFLWLNLICLQFYYTN